LNRWDREGVAQVLGTVNDRVLADSFQDAMRGQRLGQAVRVVFFQNSGTEIGRRVQVLLEDVVLSPGQSCPGQTDVEFTFNSGHVIECLALDIALPPCLKRYFNRVPAAAT
jgi:hypothetical protein